MQFFCWCKPYVNSQKELCYLLLRDCNAITECEFTGKQPQRQCNNASMSNSNAELALDNVTDIMTLLVLKKKCKERGEGSKRSKGRKQEGKQK